MIRLREHKIDTPEFYDTKIWAEEANQRPFFDSVRMRALLKHVRGGNSVLDLGAGCFGAGQFLAESSDEYNFDVDIWAVDSSRTAQQLVSKRLGTDRFSGDIVHIYPRLGVSFHYIVYDVFATYLPAMDCVIAGEVVEHMEDPAAFVEEMARLCKVGGWMTLSTVDTKCENAIKHGPYEEHIWEFEPEDLIELFKPYGEPQYSTVGDYHFIECQRT